jgi:broad specificity phosphatase PhoE
MKPLFIYLIRHGESEGNIDSVLYEHIPDWKINLTEKGKQQAIEVGKRLLADYQSSISKLSLETSMNLLFRPDFIIYSSPWYRARETTALIGNSIKAKIREDPRLREQEWGNYAEDHLKRKIKLERKEFGTFFYRMPYGESGADVYDRITTFIDTMHRDFEKKLYPVATIIVSHGLTIKAFFTRFFHWSFEQFDGYKNPENCEIFKMELDDSLNKYVLKTPMKLRVEFKKDISK